MLGESGSGKTENCRMIIKFLSKISGRFIPLQRQRSSTSISSFKSSPNSTSSTPKHKSLVPNNSSSNSTPHFEKSSCFKTSDSGRTKKPSRVEFDFSYQKCNDNDFKADPIKFCPKHNCCNQIVSSSSSNASNPIEIPRKKSANFVSSEFPTTSKSCTIYEAMNCVHKASRVPNCLDQPPDQKQMRSKCESLDLISAASHHAKPRTADMSSSLDETIYLSRSVEKPLTLPQSNNLSNSSYNKSNINLDNFKSAKRKVPTKNLSKLNSQLNNLEIQTMKERIAQAEVFLEAMGCASIVRNRDSSRYVSWQRGRELSDSPALNVRSFAGKIF